ncbi:MAG: histidine phosphatase family protein, partial [Oscillospiraceae bacterium]|nr:histidine phosphatase family protein [Oscillospiraceae bacterium]
MKLLFIRHGDPDYFVDGLTETGRREAELLAERIAPMDITEYFVSPLGRAVETARPTLEKAGRTAVTYDWLREFDIRVHRPDREGRLSVVPW